MKSIDVAPRAIALSLFLALGLPDPAFALRVQAGLESTSGPDLKTALLESTSAGLEEVLTVDEAVEKIRQGVEQGQTKVVVVTPIGHAAPEGKIFDFKQGDPAELFKQNVHELREWVSRTAGVSPQGLVELSVSGSLLGIIPFPIPLPPLPEVAPGSRKIQLNQGIPNGRVVQEVGPYPSKDFDTAIEEFRNRITAIGYYSLRSLRGEPLSFESARWASLDQFNDDLDSAIAALVLVERTVSALGERILTGRSFRGEAELVEYQISPDAPKELMLVFLIAEPTAGLEETDQKDGEGGKGLSSPGVTRRDLLVYTGKGAAAAAAVATGGVAQSVQKAIASLSSQLASGRIGVVLVSPGWLENWLKKRITSTLDLFLEHDLLERWERKLGKGNVVVTTEKEEVVHEGFLLERLVETRFPIEWARRKWLEEALPRAGILPQLKKLEGEARRKIEMGDPFWKDLFRTLPRDPGFINEVAYRSNSPSDWRETILEVAQEEFIENEVEASIGQQLKILSEELAQEAVRLQHAVLNLPDQEREGLGEAIDRGEVPDPQEIKEKALRNLRERRTLLEMELEALSSTSNALRDEWWQFTEKEILVNELKEIDTEIKHLATPSTPAAGLEEESGLLAYHQALADRINRDGIFHIELDEKGIIQNLFRRTPRFDGVFRIWLHLYGDTRYHSYENARLAHYDPKTGLVSMHAITGEIESYNTKGDRAIRLDPGQGFQLPKEEWIRLRDATLRGGGVSSITIEKALPPKLEKYSRERLERRLVELGGPGSRIPVPGTATLNLTNGGKVLIYVMSHDWAMDLVDPASGLGEGLYHWVAKDVLEVLPSRIHAILDSPQEWGVDFEPRRSVRSHLVKAEEEEYWVHFHFYYTFPPPSTSKEARNGLLARLIRSKGKIIDVDRLMVEGNPENGLGHFVELDRLMREGKVSEDDLRSLEKMARRLVVENEKNRRILEQAIASGWKPHYSLGKAVEPKGALGLWNMLYTHQLPPDKRMFEERWYEWWAAYERQDPQSATAGLEESIPLTPDVTASKVVFITPEMASPSLFESLKIFKPAPGKQLQLVVFAEHAFHAEEIEGWLNQADLTALEIVNVQKEISQHIAEHPDWNLFDVVAAKQTEYYLGTGADIHSVWSFEDLKNLGRFLGIAPSRVRLWEKSLERQYGTQA